MSLSELFLNIGSYLKVAGFVLAPFLLLPILGILFPEKIHPFSSKLSKSIDRFSQLGMGVSTIACLVMFFSQIAIVFLRYMFSISYSWLNEIVIYSFAALFIFAVASTLRDDKHVRVDVLRDRMSPKLVAAVELSGFFFFLLPVCMLILWAFEPALTRSWKFFEGSRESDGLNYLYLFKTMVPVLAITLIIQGLSESIKAAHIFNHHSDLTNGKERMD